MLNQLLSFAGWTYLPNIATRQLLPVFHYFYRTVLHRIPPAPRTPLYAQHYRYTYAFAIFSYLLYNFYTATSSVAPNYYEMLGVGPEVGDGALKIAFRQFARKNHPDRVGSQGEDFFIEVRDAFDALKNPVTRFAYDRFGPDAMKWTHCTTPPDYIRHGLMQSSGFYIISALVLLVWSAIGKHSPVAFWRYILFVTFFAYELALILYSPLPPSSPKVSNIFATTIGAYPRLFSLIWPRRVAYQHIRFLHNAFVFMSIALSRVAPVLFMQPPDATSNPKILQEELNKLNALAQTVDNEVSSHIQIELCSVAGPPTSAVIDTAQSAKPSEKVISTLSLEMENMVIENRLKRDAGPLKSVIEAAIQRRRHSEPPPSRRALGIPSPTPSPPPSQSPRASTASPRRTFAAGKAGGVPLESWPGYYVRGRSKSY